MFDGKTNGGSSISINESRAISRSTVNSRHPLNVKPLGNKYLQCDDGVQKQCSKEAQMGYFSILPEELVLEILTYINNEKALKNLSHTSRIMYAYCFDEELWKRLYIRRVTSADGSANIDWKGSWRASILGINEEDQSKIQLRDNLLCSDLLYRPYQCSQIDYEKVFHRVLKEEESASKYALATANGIDSALENLTKGRIARIDEKSLTLGEFNERLNDKPFILTNSDPKRWPSWDLEELINRFPDVKFRQEAVQWPLSLYAKYLKNNQDESPLYLFDCRSTAMKTLREEYTVPEVFQEDLFSVFQVGELNCRPDHAWLIVGPARSGSTFHKDPNNTSAWNAAISGRKLWIMFPPRVLPPGVGTDKEESEVTSPVGLAEWVISGFYNDAEKDERCLIGMTFPGECMYVPAGWWHSVINIDDSIALTQNFVPSSKLVHVLQFFGSKRDQISGFSLSQFLSTVDKLDSIVQNENDNIKSLREYRNKVESLQHKTDLVSEDCGELSTTLLPPMPIRELFEELLILNGKSKQLNDAIEHLTTLESTEGPKSNSKNIWSTAVKPFIAEKESTTEPFSFGFDLDESSDEEKDN